MYEANGNKILEEFFSDINCQAKHIRKIEKDVIRQELLSSTGDNNMVHIDVFKDLQRKLQDSKLWNGKLYGKNKDVFYVDGIKYQLYV